MSPAVIYFASFLAAYAGGSAEMAGVGPFRTLSDCLIKIEDVARESRPVVIVRAGCSIETPENLK